MKSCRFQIAQERVSLECNVRNVVLPLKTQRHARYSHVRLALIALAWTIFSANLITEVWADDSAETAKQIAVLESDAPYFQKVLACKKLATVGTKEAVPVLARFLGDPKMSHYARFALQPVPDPSVDAALRDAAEKTRRPFADRLHKLDRLSQRCPSDSAFGKTDKKRQRQVGRCGRRRVGANRDPRIGRLALAAFENGQEQDRNPPTPAWHARKSWSKKAIRTPRSICTTRFANRPTCRSIRSPPQPGARS